MKPTERKQILMSIKKYAEKNSIDNDIHGFKHVERVFDLCLEIGKNSGANIFILKIAALLHDIGRIREKESLNTNHADLSAKMALEFLTKNNYNFKKNEIDNIIHSIKAHSFSNNIKPNTLEAKILSDADKLDALGAVGLYRTIGFTLNNKGNIRSVIQHLKEKILKLPNNMILDESKKIAQRRVEIIKTFYEQIKKEI
ncbi:MAG: HD domain-containing protein [Promethearchaeati archaeon]